MAQDNKLQTAIDKARNKETGQEMEVSSAVPPGAEAMVKTFKHNDELAQHVAADLATGNYEAAPQLFSLEEGQMIEGILEGNGPVAEFTKVNKDTGEVTTNEVKTWIIADKTKSLRVSILSSAQLDRKLLGFIGCPVKIARGKDKNIGDGKRMTEYMVWGPRLSGGAKRQWFDLSNEARAALEANKQHALPAAT
jgi:hypothetical protein